MTKTFQLSLHSAIVPNEPLHHRVPKRDEHGRALSDMMLMIPDLKLSPAHEVQVRVRTINAILASFKEVVFADLNVPLNVLWISVKPEPGILPRVAASIQQQIPGALLVGSHF